MTPETRQMDERDLLMLSLARRGVNPAAIARRFGLARRTIARRIAAITTEDMNHDPTAKDFY